ncbi:CAMK family protein kinase [Trichomonas vaginalis G3]|uniref:CAMK family protein kinase n=1 Tax=Trichomonas vaginalis (strain ATCC PRA-98 / G3) TaxID=412133 RepID=A2FY15_TRIV3|nr:protein serine/threonine kinase protein [Trichomonas vaginalis G3]EAX90214.1 CAMK family protein kinase [Trichomonas vaginalis G3]KAI5492477.1 protein serine/threonine kinase protein [Trichomonas vaginalis G3]|eukprot:XP_001303144.1 CAMK family protein kinase [Trichomonas vaginalis G3]
MNPSELEFFKQQKMNIEQSIAVGGFGEIFLVYSEQYKMHFAMKKIESKFFNRTEIDVLQSIDNNNIVRLYSYFELGEHVFLLMEYCPSDLYQYVKENEDIEPEKLRKYIQEMVLSIKACHDYKIAHNDIKPSNFLLDKYGRVKVCDFGLSMIHEEDSLSKSYKGTLFFMAPEQLRRTEYNPIKADIWSLGVTMFYMATKTYPFIASHPDLILKLIDNGNYPIFAVKNPNLRRIIMKCLQVDPSQRPTCEEILAMPYFASNSIKGVGIHAIASTNHCKLILKPNASSEKSIFDNKHSFVSSKRLRPKSLLNTKR